MSVFVDTSGIVAVLDRDDESHDRACAAWAELVRSQTPLFATNYAVVELSAVVQRKLGMGAVGALFSDFVPGMAVIFVDSAVHDAGVQAFRSSNRRSLSLVDCTSFVTMRALAISRVFAFDAHFAEHGFELIPGIDEPPLPGTS